MYHRSYPRTQVQALHSKLPQKAGITYETHVHAMNIGISLGIKMSPRYFRSWNTPSGHRDSIGELIKPVSGL